MFHHTNSTFESVFAVDDIYHHPTLVKLYNKDYNDSCVSCFSKRIHSRHVHNLSLNKSSQSKPSHGVFFSNFPLRLTERPSGSLGFNNQKLSCASHGKNTFSKQTF